MHSRKRYEIVKKHILLSANIYYYIYRLLKEIHKLIISITRALLIIISVYKKATFVYGTIKNKFNIGDEEIVHRIGYVRISFALNVSLPQKQNSNHTNTSNVLKQPRQIQTFLWNETYSFRNIQTVNSIKLLS